MCFRLRYRQGSFSNEVRCDLEEVAILRARELMRKQSGCLDFEIIDARGNLVKSEKQIRHACECLAWGIPIASDAAPS